MTNRRKTTYEKRIEIVTFFIATVYDYNLTVNKVNWIRKIFATIKLLQTENKYLKVNNL